MQIFPVFSSVASVTLAHGAVRRPIIQTIRYAYAAALTAGAYGLITFGVAAGVLLALKAFQ